MSEQPTKSDMDKCMQYATPGEGHKVLSAFEGVWNASCTFFMDPSAPPQKSNGVMTNQWVLGNRYLQQNYKGEAFGCPFEGIGHFGFNNGSKKYEGSWIDTASTCLSTEVGGYDPKTKTFTMKGSFSNPSDGSSGTKRTLIKIKSPDEHTMESYIPGSDGKEHKCMEIIYKRKK